MWLGSSWQAYCLMKKLMQRRLLCWMRPHTDSFNGLYADLKGDVLNAQGKTEEARAALQSSIRQNRRQESLSQLDPDETGCTWGHKMKSGHLNLLRLMAILAVVLLAGCSTTWLQNSWIGKWYGNKSSGPAKLVELKPTATVEERWHYDLGSGGGNVLQPAVTSDAVYAANYKGEVFRLDRATGKQVWHADSEFPISGGVGAGEG